MKTIWILNHNATNGFNNHGSRHYCFAKYLIRAGYAVRIFCASTVHNTDINYILDAQSYREDNCDGIPYVFIKCRSYSGNGKTRIFNMLDYYFGLFKAVKHFEKPEVIIGSSVHPLACVAAIKLGEKYHCKAIAEIRDLWPESIVAYGINKKSNPIIQALYHLEKWIYAKADAVIFTMEGGKDYIIEKGWDKQSHGGPIDLDKVHHINNGVDLDVFDYNREHYTFADPDLDDRNKFKVIYCGSVRKANNVGQLVDVAKKLHEDDNGRIQIIIYGDGDERARLESESAYLDNIVFKGHIEKKYIPFALSKCDLSLMHSKYTPIAKYGLSLNKSFEYMAIGKPIIMNFVPCYDYIEKNKCGVVLDLNDTNKYTNVIVSFSDMPKDEYAAYCENARKAAEKYDFKELTKKLVEVLNK